MVANKDSRDNPIAHFLYTWRPIGGPWGMAESVVRCQTISPLGIFLESSTALTSSIYGDQLEGPRPSQPFGIFLMKEQRKAN